MQRFRQRLSRRRGLAVAALAVLAVLSGCGTQGVETSASFEPYRPAAAAGYCTSGAVEWSRGGTTITVRPGQSIQRAVNRADSGDTIELADGTYRRATVTLRKGVRLRAANPFGARLVGTTTPRAANDTLPNEPPHYAVAVRASRAMVEGLDIRHYRVGVDVSSARDVVVQRNRITSNYNVGIQLWDTRESEVRCNRLLDPYLANDPVGSLTSGAGLDAQMDYGVAVYGSVAPRVHHNYFHGVFNQALSFKEGSRDPYAGYNTFEGFNLTALFFGQNRPRNGPYEYTGLPTAPDRGSLVGEYNVFRSVYGIRRGERVVYHARSPIRVWHVDGNTTLRGNVIESAQQGIVLECRADRDPGCAEGTIRLEGNTIAGRVRDLSGNITTVNRGGGVQLYSGLRAQITLHQNVFAALSTPVKLYFGGVSGTPSTTRTEDRVLSNDSAAAELRRAHPVTEPDLAYAIALARG